METDLFDFAAERLEHATSLDRLQARGTLRIALKQAGLEPASLTLDQLRVVLERILPGELDTRGVAGAADTCNAILQQASDSPRAAEWQGSGSVDEIFRRLGRD